MAGWASTATRQSPRNPTPGPSSHLLDQPRRQMSAHSHKLVLSHSERLDERDHDRVLGVRHGDPHDELLGAWVASWSATG
jgi:hypothetical protein